MCSLGPLVVRDATKGRSHLGPGSPAKAANGLARLRKRPASRAPRRPEPGTKEVGAIIYIYIYMYAIYIYIYIY